MKPRPMLTSDVLACPYCKSDEVEVRQMGYAVNTLMMICFICTRAANFRGPDVAWTKELQQMPVRTRFEAYLF
jgi:uncharacterized protein YbaR (Trm112 family)